MGEPRTAPRLATRTWVYHPPTFECVETGEVVDAQRFVPAQGDSLVNQYDGGCVWRWHGEWRTYPRDFEPPWWLRP